MSEPHLHEHKDHAHESQGHQKAQRRIGIAAVITFTFMFAEAIGGIISGSLALLADAAHMLTDAGSLALAYVGYSLARKPPDVNRTFGFSRFKILAAFTNGLLLLALAAWIVFEAIQRVLSPEPIMSTVMFVIAVIGLIINLVMFKMLHSGQDHDHEHSHGDVNMEGAIAHVLGDLLGSVAAIAAAIIIWTTGWTIADPILSVLVAALLLRSAIPIIRKSSHILLQGTPKGIDLQTVADGICSAVPEVMAVHHLHAWTMTGEDRLMTLHVIPKERENAISLIPRIRNVLITNFGIDHATIELDLEPLDHCDFPTELGLKTHHHGHEH